MTWRAVYDDGTIVGEDDHAAAYSTLDRRRMERFDVFTDPRDLLPSISVHIPVGRRLVRRVRVSWPSGDRVLMVGTESEDRSDVDVHFVRAIGGGIEHRRITAYGTDAATCPPELFPFETARD